MCDCPPLGLCLAGCRPRGMEAYVTMVYGPADASSLRGLHVLLDSLRAHEATDGDGAQTPREVLVLRLLDDDDSPALEAACRRYAPARVHRVARLALDPRIHPTCARQLSAWAGATSSANRGAASGRSAAGGSGGGSVGGSGASGGGGGGGGRQLKQHGGAGEKAHHRREQLSLPMRSIFSVFAVWSLANQGYSRVLWLETDQLVVGSLAGLWRMQLPYAPPRPWSSRPPHASTPRPADHQRTALLLLCCPSCLLAAVCDAFTPYTHAPPVHPTPRTHSSTHTPPHSQGGRARGRRPGRHAGLPRHQPGTARRQVQHGRRAAQAERLRLRSARDDAQQPPPGDPPPTALSTPSHPTLALNPGLDDALRHLHRRKEAVVNASAESQSGSAQSGSAPAASSNSSSTTASHGRSRMGHNHGTRSNSLSSSSSARLQRVWPVPVGNMYRRLAYVTCTDGFQTMWNMVRLLARAPAHGSAPHRTPPHDVAHRIPPHATSSRLMRTCSPPLPSSCSHRCSRTASSASTPRTTRCPAPSGSAWAARASRGAARRHATRYSMAPQASITRPSHLAPTLCTLSLRSDARLCDATRPGYVADENRPLRRREVEAVEVPRGDRRERSMERRRRLRRSCHKQRRRRRHCRQRRQRRQWRQ